MYPALKRATIAHLVITKTRMASRIALGAFPGSTKMKKARVRVKNALKTRHQPIATVPHHVAFVGRAEQHAKEACLVRNVWPGNLKKPQARTKRFVSRVHRAITQTIQTRQMRASSAQLGMLNRRLGKRRALNAAPVNSMMLSARSVVHCVRIRRTLVEKEETAVASIVQLVGLPKTAVRNVLLVMLEHLAKPRVFVRHAPLGFIKIPKVKQSAVTLVPRPEKYPTMKARGVNCRPGVPANQVNI
jgi:hypothetical protein